MLLRIQHETKLSYSEPVSETVFDVRMAPPSDEDQTNLDYRLRILPSAPVTVYRDGFGNRVDLFNIITPYSELIIRATSIVRTHRASAPESRLEEVTWEALPPAQTAIESLEYLQSSPLVNPCPELEQFIAGLKKPEGALRAVIDQLIAAVSGTLGYEKKVTTARTPVGEALRLGRGVCQDFAHLFLAASRGIGLPARYVSGYIHEPGEMATHAWCQVWTGKSGWLDVDPTRGAFAGDDYIKIAVGRDYSDVPPNRGVWKGQAEETIAVSVKVEPIDRVPADWSDWTANQAPWSASSWVQSQTRLERAKFNPQAGYRQQQGQQQQYDVTSIPATEYCEKPPARDRPATARAPWVSP
jgi:transglutaminase-like putative cysteine protease